MPFAITQSCCTDASCVAVCPVGCIHPAPGEPGFGSSEILHIDPRACIDCGACADACPVDAIFPVDRLGPTDEVYATINRAYFETPIDMAPPESVDAPPTRVDAAPHGYPLIAPVPSGARVAVIGSGPAGMYTVKELLARTTAHVVVIDALPTPGGLVRSGVAPDHPATKGIQHTFDVAMRHPRVTYLGGVHVGESARSVTLDEIRACVDAVFVATGARRARHLGVPGEELPGVVTARDVTAWAGGVPDHDTSPVLDGGASRRAVGVGTGNVALDIARLFTLAPEELARTDIVDRALHALRSSPVDEVVVLGRGKAGDAACTQAEFSSLTHLRDVEVVSIDSGVALPEDLRHPPSRGRRITFVFGSRVTRFDSSDGAGIAVTIERDGDTTVLDAALAVMSLGQDVDAPPGLDIDDATGAVAHERGRVRAGTYVVGWVKRGARGGIGANRGCAQESVDSYLGEAMAVSRARHDLDELMRLLAARGVRPTSRRAAFSIDRVEREAGARAGRPRIKLTSEDALLDAGRRRALIPSRGGRD